MAEPSKHINYSFEDIQRYLQGKMSATDMHELEKAALQDPFLADAIEGFNESDLTTAQQHLNEINASLYKEKIAPKVISFNKKTQWLNIAAIIIVLAGIGVLSALFLNKDSEKSQVAQSSMASEKNEMQKDTAASAAFAPTQPKTDSTVLIAGNKPAEKKQKLIPARKSNQQETIIQSDVEPDSEVGILNTKDIVEKTFTAPANAKMSGTIMNSDSLLQSNETSIQLTHKPTIFTGKVVDVNNMAIPGALIQSADKKDEVLTDMNGNFYIMSKDTALKVTASTVGYLQQSSKLKTGFNSPIVLHAMPTNLDEVVTVGYGAAKNQTAKIDSLKLQRNILDDSTMPVGGWQNFNHYVMTQLNKDTLSEPEIYSNDLVELEFLVDNEGNPYNIKITKPLDKIRDTKAIEILKNGPRWISSSHKKKTKLVISF